MPLKHKIIFALAALHLIMIALYASHFGDWANQESKAAKALATVGDFTGSNNIFSFFAPELSDQPYAIFATRDSSGKEQVIDLKGNSPDFTNRLNNIYGFMSLEEGRQMFATSLAQFISKNYPASSQIRVAMVVQQIPEMNEFNEGERKQWKFWFDRDFQNKNLTALK